MQHWCGLHLANYIVSGKRGPFLDIQVWTGQAQNVVWPLLQKGT